MSHPGRPSVSEQFYRKLLELQDRCDVEPLVEHALRLVVEASSAQVGYLELFSDEAGPTFWKAHGTTPESQEGVRARISRGVIAVTIAECRTINSASALEDDAFKELGSVKQNRIQAVLCSPIGIEVPVGVVYLQGRPGAGSFTDADRERVELFCRQLALVAARLIGLPLTEETRIYARHRARETLTRHEGNVSEAARELGIGRAWLRRILRRD
jgi:Nif-specific regulatory protein